MTFIDKIFHYRETFKNGRDDLKAICYEKSNTCFNWRGNL